MNGMHWKPALLILETLQSFKRFLKTADILTHFLLHAVLDETVQIIR